MAGVDYDAVVLAGGQAHRFGGQDKPGALVGGRSLIARVAAAVPDAARLIVVGPERPDLPPALFVREDPPGSGPIPALRTGLAEVRSPRLVLLAADLPFLRYEQVMMLLDAADAVLVDSTGREQWLTGAWHTGRLRDALAGYEGASLRGLLVPLNPARVPVAEDWFDCDTPAELERARTIEET